MNFAGAGRTRTPPSSPEDHDGRLVGLRERLRSLIRRLPGLRLNEIWKTLNADRGTAKYHLLVLERAHEVAAVRNDGPARYFPTGTPPDDRLLIALLRHGRVLQLAQAIAVEPGIEQRDLTRRLPMSRKVFRRYADLLLSSGLIRENHRNQHRLYFPTPNLERVLSSTGPLGENKNGRENGP